MDFERAVRMQVRVPRVVALDDHRCLLVDPKILQRCLKPDGFLTYRHVLCFRGREGGLQAGKGRQRQYREW